MMEFRTPIEPIRGAKPIDHDDHIVMLGSCFTTGIGERLDHDGFDVTYNPMGALYNPATIANAVTRAMNGKLYTPDELVCYNGQYHCLDFPTKYTSADADSLLEHVNSDLLALGQKLREASVWIITFGTARVYEFTDGGQIVGNCHKLPGTMFTRRLMSVDEIAATWQPIVAGRRVIFTVSPIRHVADTLHGNQLSKSTLLLAVDRLDSAEYFPSYEIILDDLRDYRFYAADMKHPSDVAVDYVYERFGETYFSAGTKIKAMEKHKEYLRSAHRPILKIDSQQ